MKESDPKTQDIFCIDNYLAAFEEQILDVEKEVDKVILEHSVKVTREVVCEATIGCKEIGNRFVLSQGLLVKACKDCINRDGLQAPAFVCSIQDCAEKNPKPIRYVEGNGTWNQYCNLHGQLSLFFFSCPQTKPDTTIKNNKKKK